MGEVENSDLMKRLRAWKIKKKEYEDEKFRQRVAETNVTLGDSSIKMMIIKLNQIEDLNKETKMVHGRVDAGEDKMQSRSSSRGSIAFNALGNRDRAASQVSRGNLSQSDRPSKGSRR